MYAAALVEPGGLADEDKDNSFIFCEGKSSLFCGGFPPSDPFEAPDSFTAVLDLTGAKVNIEARKRYKSTAEASSGRLLFRQQGVGDHALAPMDQLLGGSTDVLTYLLDAWDSGKKILVHCQQGVSRAPTVAAAFLVKLHMRSEGRLLQTAGGVGLHTAALNLVRKGRPFIQPNPGFYGRA
jgi:hypothetical protein